MLSLIAKNPQLTVESGVIPALVGFLASSDLQTMSCGIELLPRFTSSIEYLFEMIASGIFTLLHRIPQVCDDLHCYLTSTTDYSKI